MLLIKYDGITSVGDAIKNFYNVSSGGNLGTVEEGYYYIEDNILRYRKSLPNTPYYLYTSTQVSKWNSNILINLPSEIKLLARKYVTYDEEMKRRSVAGMATWSKTSEGADFWANVSTLQFHKAFEYLANHQNLLTNIKTKDHETKLQDKTSSSRAGTEPKGSIISCKKSIATITSGHLEYGRGIRG